MSYLTLRYPTSVQLEVTPCCNHSCIHCYNYWRNDEEKTYALAQTYSANHYLRLMKAIVDQKPIRVVITGGEPLLVFPKIKEAIEYALKNGVEVSINTNATLLTPEITEFLVRNKVNLFVSFPAGTEELCDFITQTPGSFRRILKGIETMIEAGIGFTINIVVSKANIDSVFKHVKMLKNQYGIKKVFLTRVGKPVNSDNSFNKYLLDKEDIQKLINTSLKVKTELGMQVSTACPYTSCALESQEAYDLFGGKKSCTAGILSYGVEASGNVRACLRDSVYYGNMLFEDFETIWARMEKWRSGEMIPEECKACKSFAICKGGCRVDAFPLTHRMDSLDTIACPENLPVRFSMHYKLTHHEDDEIFENDIISYIKENVGYRVENSSHAFLYLTDKFTNFMMEKKRFDKTMIKDNFMVDDEAADMVIDKLLGYGIIHKEGGEM